MPLMALPNDGIKPMLAVGRQQPLVLPNLKQPATQWNLISQSSLQVQTSQASTSTASQRPAATPNRSAPAAAESEEFHPQRSVPTMSLTDSLQSDSPSQRPPTPAKDLEYGIPNPDPHLAHSPTRSRHSRRASSARSDLPWNPSHPCYPHPNPHIPVASPLYSSTRVIRIPRDWMVAGDLAPTFSNTYPEILEPWVSEADFRMLIKGINEGLVGAFSPYGWRAWLDAALGIATGWIWEDVGFTGVKAKAKGVEAFIEQWNAQRGNGLEKTEDLELTKAIPLRRTGYLCLDIQIPDPHVGMVDDAEADADAPNDGGGNEEADLAHV